MKSYSLTRRLITAVLLVELCSVLALIGIASAYETVSHFRALDVMLRGRADSLLGAVQDAEDPQDNVMLDGTQGLMPKRDIYVVRDELGRADGGVLRGAATIGRASEQERKYSPWTASLFMAMDLASKGPLVRFAWPTGKYP